jgi:hypothetical protein
MPIYDYTRVSVGDKVRDNQTLEEGTIVDMQAMGQWTVLITIVVGLSGIQKKLLVQVERPTGIGGLATTSPISTLEVRADELGKAGQKVVAKAKPDSITPQVAVEARGAAGGISPAKLVGKSKLEELRLYVDKTYLDRRINGVEKEKILSLMDDLARLPKSRQESLLREIIHGPDESGVKAAINSALAEAGKTTYSEESIATFDLLVTRHSSLIGAEAEHIAFKSSIDMGKRASMLGGLSMDYTGTAAPMIRDISEALSAGVDPRDLVEDLFQIHRGNLSPGRLGEHTSALEGVLSGGRWYDPWCIRDTAWDLALELEEAFPGHTKVYSPNEFADAEYEKKLSREGGTLQPFFESRAENATLRSMHRAGTRPSGFLPTAGVSVAQYNEGVLGKLISGQPMVVEHEGLMFRITGAAQPIVGKEPYLIGELLSRVDPSKVGIMTEVSVAGEAGIGTVHELLSRFVGGEGYSVWAEYLTGKDPISNLSAAIENFVPKPEDPRFEEFLSASYGDARDPEALFRSKVMSKIRKSGIPQRLLEDVDLLTREPVILSSIYDDAFVLYYKKALEEAYRTPGPVDLGAVFNRVFESKETDAIISLLTRRAVMGQIDVDADVSLFAELTKTNEGFEDYLTREAEMQPITGGRRDDPVSELMKKASPVQEGIDYRKILLDMDLHGITLTAEDMTASMSKSRFNELLFQGLANEAEFTTVNGKLVLIPKDLPLFLRRLSEIDTLSGGSIAEAFKLSYTTINGKAVLAVPVVNVETGTGYKAAGHASTGETILEEQRGRGRLLISGEPVTVELPWHAGLKERPVYNTSYTAIAGAAVPGEAAPIYKVAAGYISSATTPIEYTAEIRRLLDVVEGKQRTILGIDIEASMDPYSFGRVWEAGVQAYTREGEGKFATAGGKLFTTRSITKEEARGMEVVQVGSESEVIERVYKELRGHPDAYSLIHNEVYDFPQLAKRAEALGMPEEVVGYFKSQTADRVIDTMRTSTPLWNPNLESYSLENVAKAAGVRELAWVEEHRAPADIQTMVDVFNEQLFGKGRKATLANLQSLDLSEGLGGLSQEAVAGKYYWNPRMGRLYTFGMEVEGGRALYARVPLYDPSMDPTLSPIAMLFEEVHGYPNLPNVPYAYITQPWVTGRELSANFKEVTAEEGRALSQRKVEDLAMKRIREIENTGSGVSAELERIRLAHEFIEGKSALLTPEVMDVVQQEVASKFPGMRERAPGGLLDQAYREALDKAISKKAALSSDMIDWVTHYVQDPRMLDQLMWMEENYFGSSTYRNILAPVYNALENTELSPQDRSYLSKTFFSKLSGVTKRPERTVEVDPANRRIAFMVEEFGEAETIRIGGAAEAASDVERVANRYVKTTSSERLARLLEGKLSPRQLTDFLIHRNISILPRAAADVVISSIRDVEIFESLRRGLTPFAKKIGGRKLYNAFAVGPEETYEELLRIGSKADLTKSQLSLLEEADFTDYGADWLAEAGKTEEATSVMREMLEEIHNPNVPSPMVSASERTAFPSGDQIPYALRGRRSLESATEEAIRRHLRDNPDDPTAAINAAKREIIRAAHKVYTDPKALSLFDSTGQEALAGLLGIPALENATSINDIADLVVPTGRHSGRKLGDLTKADLRDLVRYEGLSEEFRDTIRGFIKEPSVEIPFEPRGVATKQAGIGKVLSTIDETGRSLLSDAKDMIRGEGRGAVMAALLAATAAMVYTVGHDVDVRSDEEKMTPRQRFLHFIETKETALHHRISVNIAGDTGGLPGVSEGGIIESTRQAIAPFLPGGVNVGEVSGQDDRTNYDKRRLDKTEASLHKYTGRLM